MGPIPICHDCHYPAFAAAPLLHKYVDIKSPIFQRLLYLMVWQVLYVLDGIVPIFIPLDQLGISSRTYTAMATTQYAILPTLTILVTGLIIGRILLARWRVVKILGSCLTIFKCVTMGYSRSYRNIVCLRSLYERCRDADWIIRFGVRLEHYFCVFICLEPPCFYIF